MTLTPRFFQTTVAASLVIALGGGAIEFAFPDLVPAGVRNAETEATPSDITFSVAVVGIGALLELLLGLAAAVGLVLFRQWARPLALAVTILAIAIYPFLGFVVTSALAATAYEISSLLWGAALAMAFYSPLSKNFEHTDG